MRQTFTLLGTLTRWTRRQLQILSPLEQVVIIIVVVVASIRIIFPVWHNWDGYVLQLYPFQDSEICLRRHADCEVDRSRTAIESGSILTLGVGIVMARRERTSRRKKSKVQ